MNTLQDIKLNHLISYRIHSNDTDITMLSIINHGFIEKGKMSYLTKDGEQNKFIEEINNDHCKVVSINEVDFKGSLYGWFRDNRLHSDKEIVFYPTLTNGIQYKGSSWRYALLIEPTDDNIKVNIIFE